MTIWLKRLLFSVASILMLALFAVVLLFFLFDPNDWKPELESLAKKQGYELHIKGDIQWQFFPSLAISIGDSRLALAPPTSTEKSAANNQPFVTAEKIIAAVELKPLLERKIRIEEITLDSPNITLLTNKDGSTNYLTDSEKKPENTNTTTNQKNNTQQPLDLAIKNISINNGRLLVDNAQSIQSIEAHALNFDASDVQINGNQFPYSFSLSFSSNTLKNPVQLESKGALSFDQDQKIISVFGKEILINIANATINSSLDAVVNFKDDLKATGSIKIGNINAHKLLAALDQEPIITANPQALTRIGFSSTFSFSTNSADQTNLTLNPLTFTLDESIGNAELDLQLASSGSASINVKTKLSIDNINIDDYLAPPITADTSKPQKNTSVPADSPLPLDLLRSINVSANIHINELIASELSISNFSTSILSSKGLWKLPSIRAELYQGKLLGNASLDARKKNSPAKIEASGSIKRIELLPLFTELGDIKDIEGNANIDIKVNTSAFTTQQLFNNADAAVTFNSDLLRLHGFNIEQYYCQAAQQLGNTEVLPKSWPSTSDITSVTGALSFSQNILRINNISAESVNIGVESSGNLHLANKTFTFRVPLRLLQTENSPAGCLISSNFLKEHEIDVVECQGSLDNLDLANVCGIDSSAIGTIAKQAIRYNAGKKIDEKKKEVRQTVKDKLLEELNRNSDPKSSESADDKTENEKPTARDLLKDLLKK
ncbi:MAG: AsmA family protein [Cellvibrionaceae bacterium]